MDEVSVDLASVTLLCICYNIRKYFGPLIPHSSNAVSKLETGLMASTSSIMGIFDYLLCLLIWKTEKQESIWYALVKRPRRAVVIELRGLPFDGYRLFGVFYDYPELSVINVRESPILKFWACWSLKNFFALEVLNCGGNIPSGWFWRVLVMVEDKYFL